MPYSVFIGIVYEHGFIHVNKFGVEKHWKKSKSFFTFIDRRWSYIGKSLAYFSKTADKAKKCTELKITAITNDANSFGISFIVIAEPTDITSEQLKQKAQKILRSCRKY